MIYFKLLTGITQNMHMVKILEKLHSKLPSGLCFLSKCDYTEVESGEVFTIYDGAIILEPKKGFLATVFDYFSTTSDETKERISGCTKMLPDWNLEFDKKTPLEQLFVWIEQVYIQQNSCFREFRGFSGEFKIKDVCIQSLAE